MTIKMAMIDCRFSDLLRAQTTPGSSRYPPSGMDVEVAVSASRSHGSCRDRSQDKAALKQNLFYFHYIPYDKMSRSEIIKYAGPASVSASSSRKVKPRNSPNITRECDCRWLSASTDKSLKVFEYHLAELSLHYRSSPSLLSQRQRRIRASSDESMDDQHICSPVPLFQDIHKSQQQQKSDIMRSNSDVKKATSDSFPKIHRITQTAVVDVASRSNTEVHQNAYSEPLDIVSRSDSNKLLNVMSVDECHVTYRQRKNRCQSGQKQAPLQEDEVGDSPEQETVREEGQEAKDTKSVTAVSISPVLAPHPSVTDADKNQEVTSTRKSRKQTEKEQKLLAATRANMRNGLLREKMAMYLDWKLHQERCGRESLLRGRPPRSSTRLRKLSAKDRMDSFCDELAMQEASLVLEDEDGMSELDSHLKDSSVLVEEFGETESQENSQKS